MSKFKEYLIRERQDAYPIEDGEQSGRTKDDYIVDAEEGVIVAFRLNFTAKSGVKLTKVISGKILENVKEEETYVIETRNGLRYGVPYASVVWVKTGNRWPKGVYEEMKRGSVERDSEDDHDTEFAEMHEPPENDFEYDDDTEESAEESEQEFEVDRSFK